MTEYDVVGHLHHVVEKAGFVVPAYVKDVNEALVGTRERLEIPDAREFPVKGRLAFEAITINDFHRAVRSHDVSGQPDLAIAAFPDTTQEGMIRDGRDFFNGLRGLELFWLTLTCAVENCPHESDGDLHGWNDCPRKPKLLLPDQKVSEQWDADDT